MVWAGWGALLHYLPLSGRFYWKVALSAQSIRRYLGRLWCKMDRKPHPAPAMPPFGELFWAAVETRQSQMTQEAKLLWKSHSLRSLQTHFSKLTAIVRDGLLMESSVIGPEAKHQSNKSCSKLLHVPSHRQTIRVNLLFQHTDSESSGKRWWWSLVGKYTINPHTIPRKTRIQIREAFHFLRINKAKSRIGLNNSCTFCTTM